MNTKIQDLKKELTTIQHNAYLIEQKIQAEYNVIFEADQALQKAIKDAEDNHDYGVDEYNDVYTWTRHDLSRYEEVKQYLNAYLQENRYSAADYKNSCILYSWGPLDSAIVINEDGDIFNEGECIIDAGAYNTKEERNKLIEGYMERRGYYPDVFLQDHYGNITVVNTKK